GAAGGGARVKDEVLVPGRGRAAQLDPCDRFKVLFLAAQAAARVAARAAGLVDPPPQVSTLKAGERGSCHRLNQAAHEQGGPYLLLVDPRRPQRVEPNWRREVNTHGPRRHPL